MYSINLNSHGLHHLLNCGDPSISLHVYGLYHLIISIATWQYLHFTPFISYLLTDPLDLALLEV